MPNASLAFDHVHLVSKDPHAAAHWYVDKLGGEVVRTAEVRGAPQIYVSFGGAMIIVRGQRPAELGRRRSPACNGASITSGCR
jgi:catechol 2,3-dioxygenase-like lactoylglutathione lyase family enzyme